MSDDRNLDRAEKAEAACVALSMAVDGHKERAEKAEAEVERLRAELEQVGASRFNAEVREAAASALLSEIAAGCPGYAKQIEAHLAGQPAAPECSTTSKMVLIEATLRRAQDAQPIGRTRLLDIERGAERLTLDEKLAGWHLCAEFDEGLTPGEQLNEKGECAWCGHSGRRFAKGTIEGLEKALETALNERDAAHARIEELAMSRAEIATQRNEYYAILNRRGLLP